MSGALKDFVQLYLVGGVYGTTAVQLSRDSLDGNGNVTDMPLVTSIEI